MQTYLPGTRIGQYEIASHPMVGGMGVVYFALDHSNDGRPVAIKTFRPELLPDRAARDRFLREGTAWIELGSHPHIVRCYKVEYIDPTAFLVLELIAKEQNMPDASLRSWLIPGHPLPIEQALQFALQIARGMQYATEKIPSFVHRDLKPENILVGADKLPNTNINRLRVTDFGLVKTIGESEITSKLRDAKELKPNKVQFTRGVGTPLYMAPEQWMGKPVGIFTDVYTFGCIFYEILTGKRIALGNTIMELQTAHCEGRLNPMPRGLHETVQEVLMQCLALKTEARYQSWNTVLSGLVVICDVQKVSPPERKEERGESTTELLDKASSYNEIGCSYIHIGNPDLAIGYFEKALAICCEAGDRIGEGAVLNQLGLAYADLGNQKRALDYYKKCLLISRETGDQRGEGNALGNLGGSYLTLGIPSQAISFIEKYLAVTRKVKDLRGEGMALCNLGNAYADLGDLHQAIRYYEQYLAITSQIGDRRGEGLALGNLGSVCSQLGELLQAIKYYEQQLKIAREIGDRRSEGLALGNMGKTYLGMGNEHQAIGYIEQQAAIAHEIGDRFGESAALGSQGMAYHMLGNPRRAIENYDQQLLIARDIGDRSSEAFALAGLGIVFMDLGDRKSAISFFEKSLEIVQEIGNSAMVAEISFNLAHLYSQDSDLARAMHLAQISAQIWTQISHPNLQNAQKLVDQLLDRSK